MSWSMTDTRMGALARPLDLDEDEGAAVAGDDVELAVAGAGVALDDLPAGGGETVGNEVLGDGAGAAPGDGHMGPKGGKSRTLPQAGSKNFQTARNACAEAA